MSKSRISDRGSNCTAALERAWEGLRRIHTSVPRAVVLTLSAGDRPHRWGHFCPSSWRHRNDTRKHEVGIKPDLFNQPKAVLAALVHEAAHAILQNDNGGCTGLYYHRKEFRNVCRNLGLECGFRNTRYGWCNTAWPGGRVPKMYRPILVLLRRDLPMGTGRQKMKVAAKRKLPEPGHQRLVCGCPSRAIYVSRTVARQGALHCGLCQEEFRAPGSEKAER